jgi:predicted anti-sigma-YlaC factor YlaD
MKRALIPIAAALAIASCSPRKYAVNQLGNALAGSGSTFSSDSDPELIRGAVPFGLKLVEGLLTETPRHEGLLLAANKGFTQYAYAFVLQDADELEDKDRAAAQAMRLRASKLFLRARDYGLRGLELKHPGFPQQLKANPKTAVESLTAKEVPFAYWTSVSWAGALASSRDMFMLPQIPQFEALIERALALDESYDQGAIHAFMITFEMNSPTRQGEKARRAKERFDRAVELSGGRQAGPYVAYAESVLVPAKDRAGFEAMLKKALDVDVNAQPDYRVFNLVLQRRARWLLSRADKLFPAPSAPGK